MGIIPHTSGTFSPQRKNKWGKMTSVCQFRQTNNNKEGSNIYE